MTWKKEVVADREQSPTENARMETGTTSEK